MRKRRRWPDWLVWLSLLWIIIRIEAINSKLVVLGELLSSIGEVLLINLTAAADQFHAAITSILSLFGGSGA